MREFDQVEQRLSRAAELSLGMRYDAPRVDMSAEAVDLRLRQASELSRACLQLQRAGEEWQRIVPRSR